MREAILGLRIIIRIKNNTKCALAINDSRFAIINCHFLSLNGAPRTQPALNSFLLTLLDFLRMSNVPQQMRLFDALPLLAVCLLLGSLLTFK